MRGWLDGRSSGLEEEVCGGREGGWVRMMRGEERMDVCMHLHAYGWLAGCMHACMYGCLHGCKDGGVDGCMHGG